MICKLRKFKRVKAVPKLQHDKLQKDTNVKVKYMDSLKRRYKEINQNGNSKWNALREGLVTSASEIISKKTRRRELCVFIEHYSFLGVF